MSNVSIDLFSLYVFFPNTDHVMFSREFAFSLFINKNALSSCESCLLGDKFCCQRRWCYYATFSFGIQNECYKS